MSATKTTKVMTVKDAVELIKGSNGKFLTVSFIKRSNNELRVLNGRTGVRRGVKGVGNKIGKSAGLITIYDMVKHEFRNINVSGIREVKVGGKTYKVA